MFQVSLTSEAAKVLKKLDPPIKRRIKVELERISSLENPRSVGKSLTGTLSEYWRYRVGDHRIIVRIIDNQLIIVVVRIAHRSKAY